MTTQIMFIWILLGLILCITFEPNITLKRKDGTTFDSKVLKFLTYPFLIIFAPIIVLIIFLKSVK